MQIDPLLPPLVGACLGIALVGLLFRRIGQPYVLGYLLAGIALGPHGIGLITDEATLSRLGSLGVVILLFFVGLEIDPTRILRDWRTATIGTAAQVLISVGAVWVLGLALGWAAGRTVLLGFVISLSSTVVVVRLLQEKGCMDSGVGPRLLGITVAQDIAVVPMLLVLGFLVGTAPSGLTISLQVCGALFAAFVLFWAMRSPRVSLGIGRIVGGDAELQVFAGLILCFGLALVTGLFRLSTGLGALLAGIVVARAEETAWIRIVLEPFRVVFVALFFVSVGMLLDLGFVREHLGLLGILVALVFGTNSFINAVVLRAAGTSWRSSIWGGALLAPIGELSFLLAAVGLEAKIIGGFGYQATVATITVTLLLGPIWLAIVERFARPEESDA